MAKESLVLLHGWGFNRFIWDPILPELNKHFDTIALDLKPTTLIDLCDWIAKNTPEKAIYLGWSLGGLVAMAMSTRYPERVKKLISVCASPHFLKGENWPGIESQQLEHFAEQFRADPIHWSTQFIQSQLGVLNIENLDLSRFQNLPPASREHLDAGLDILRSTDIRHELGQSQHEKLFIFGRLDRITPEKTSSALLNEKIPHLSCETIKRAAHIPFLSHPEIFLNLVHDFCVRPDDTRKKWIKKSFNEAASTYHEAALIQAECAEKLLAKLPEDFQPKTILELGCGTGLLTQGLIKKFPSATITAIDIAEKMLEKMQAPLSTPAGPTLNRVCADAESLPFSENTFDLIISNFTLQWCELSETLSECQRVLNNKGFLYFCTLGENTLAELKTCWREIDEASHVNEFPSPQNIEQLLQEKHFQNTQITTSKTEEYHDHPLGIISQIKAWGAHNIHKDRPRGLCGKSKFKKLIALYQENFQRGNGVYASYHTLYGSARKN